MRLIICAASFPSPLRITRSLFLRTLFAFAAILIAPSAAAKDSCPARKAKHCVSSLRRRAPRFPCPRPTFLSSATDPGRQNAWSPSPIAAAASEPVIVPAFSPFLRAIAEPRTYAHFASSKQICCVDWQISYGSKPLALHKSRAA